ncbi:hypothetical protein ACHQM5_010188 [Ranunculus cassubicifolius]
MASKHLKELLSEDQEPFVLKSYIDEQPKTHLQLKKRKPISENSSFPRNFYRNACFLASSASPDVKKSPLCSPVKSPFRSSNSLFVHIPTRTAAVLVEAALRIQKNSALKKSKSRRSIGFGFFGSILKRLTNRRRNQKKDIVRWDNSLNYCEFSKEITLDKVEEKLESEIMLSCSCNSRRSSVWSESNEEKSFDLETSSSRSEEEFQDIEFLVPEEMKNAAYSSYEKEFCSSPFQFVLHNSSLSPCRQSPKQSPPSRINGKAGDNGNMSLTNAAYDDEDKEQNSPVSVLDPPFEDYDDEQEDDESEGCYELRSNVTNVQRPKQKLMHRLRRFETLPELVPVELERRIAEDEDRDAEKQYDHGSVLSNIGKDNFDLVRELLTKSNMFTDQRIPSDMKRLVQDLVDEERGDDSDPCSRVLVVKRVRERLESWKDVELNTIDMMVDFDFRKDASEWAKNPEQMQETVAVIELVIFSSLMEEISDELVQGSDF